jgi:hypothetical protein
MTFKCTKWNHDLFSPARARAPSYDDRSAGQTKEGKGKKRKSPSHNELAKTFMPASGEGFSQNIRPVKIGVHLDNFDKALTNLITEVVIFECNVLSSLTGCLTVSKNNARGIVFKNLSGIQCRKLSCVERIAQRKGDDAIPMDLL